MCFCKETQTLISMRDRVYLRNKTTGDVFDVINVRVEFVTGDK